MKAGLGVALLVALFVAQFGTPSAVTTTITSGDSGDDCGSSPECLGDGTASCTGNRCRCNAPLYSGLGHFLCHRPNEVFCAMFSDPTVVSYDGTSSQAPLSCKFKMSHLLLPICDTANPLNPAPQPSEGTCDVRVLAWGGRRLGKTFLKGIDVRFMVIYNSVAYHWHSVITSTAENGVYTFKESTTTAAFGGVFGGPSLNLTIPGLGKSIYTSYDTDDNFARVVGEMCGVEIGIRGVDHVLPHMDTTAGVYIKVNNGCNPVYQNPQGCLCSPPTGLGPSLDDLAKELAEASGRETVSKDVATFYKVVTGSAPQDFDGAPAALQELMDTAQDCPLNRVVDAIERCLFIIDQPRFLKCIDDTENLETAIGMMNMCMFGICEDNFFPCDRVKQAINETDCVPPRPAHTILEMECPSQNPPPPAP